MISNRSTVEVFRRPTSGQPFTYDTTIDLGPNHGASSLDVENGTIVVGLRYDCAGGPASCDGAVDVYRSVPCLGSGWQRTHALRTAHRHNGDVHLGTAVSISEDRIIAGMSDYIFLNGPFHGLRAGAASVFDVPRDCNGNGIEDTCEILAGEADVDGDGVLDECEAVGRRYCSPGNPTFLGTPAYVMLQGSDRTSEDRMFFTFVGVPPGAPGLMLASRQAGFAAHPAGSRGDLCLGEPIGRFAGRTHSYWFAGGDGVISQRYPLTSPLPGGGPMLAGETWFFQGWFREAGSSNLTDAIQLVMR